MRNRRINWNTVNSSVVLMQGGLNENSASLELKGGELTSVKNYEILQGSQSGYSSIPGYERYDGTALASTVALDGEGDDTSREAARALIDEVPGIDNVLGVWIYQSELYAFRNASGSVTAKMWHASPTGWVEIDTSANPLDPDGDYHFINYNFGATAGTEKMYWVDGVNKAREFDGTTVTVIDNAGMDPNDAPINLAASKDRLFLAYRRGSLQSSKLGEPETWDSGNVEFGLGSEITNLETGVGNALIVFCESAIKILNGTSDSDTWSMDTFTESSGAYHETTSRLFGTIYYMNDSGVTSLASVSEFGDFATNGISQKVYKTLQRYKAISTAAVTSRDKNQYRLYFSNGLGVYFSFTDKKLKGVTLIEFPDPVLKCIRGIDSVGNSVIYFTSNTGYVYKMDSGTSFDGENIETFLATAFYHYGSPRDWKRFQSITAEISSIGAIDIGIRTLFDYDSSYLPNPIERDIIIEGAGGIWGVGEWGEMIYSTSKGINRIVHSVRGLAANMSVEARTDSRFNTPHNFQNFITDYERTRRQL